MKHDLVLNDEELAALDTLLRHEVEETRVELHHTDDRKFRRQVRHRLDVVERMLGRVDRELTAQSTPAL
jgi:ABC-type nitrate/sulfonate/bicarbonate transport system ATPase subunit